MLVAGGSNGGDEDDLTSAELYDPTTGTWSATGSMIKPHAFGFPATLLRDGKVLVGDIEDADADEPVSGAEVYDPASGTWATTGRMVKAYQGTATLVARRQGPRHRLRAAPHRQVYDPSAGCGPATGKMATPRASSHAATLLPDGKVLVVGGTGSAITHAIPRPSCTTRHGDVDRDRADAREPRCGITATLLRGRKGARDGLALGDGTSPEVYRPGRPGPGPRLGTWPDRASHYGSATLLSDGTVLVADDYGAELYDPGTGSWTTTGYHAPRARRAPSRCCSTARSSWQVAPSAHLPWTATRPVHRNGLG